MSKSNAIPALSETVSNAVAADDDQVYIPRTKRPRKEDLFIDKASLEHQSVAWYAFKETINDLVKQIHTSNVKIIIRQLLQNSIIRFRGILANNEFHFDEYYEANEENYTLLRKIKFNDTVLSQHLLESSQQQNQQVDNYTADLNLSSSGSSVGEKEN
ncbi:unnamed protein product [Rotaria socialis]|uniref:Uncharacterized protein n=1 Tax=Rotaria socialis TaxID=392032 RepID=A0A821VNA4_9BILA|nr:unnamed protein product [Rotaria socialis]